MQIASYEKMERIFVSTDVFSTLEDYKIFLMSFWTD